MNKMKIEKLFFFISIIVGSLLIFLVPPFQSPDEDTHFTKSYLIMNGDFYPEEKDKKVGFEVPVNMSKFIDEKLTWASNREQKYSYNDMYLDQLLSVDYSKKEFKEISTGNTSPVAHIVPALGIGLSKIFNQLSTNGSVSVSYMLLFARFISLICYSLIGYYVLKRTPLFKKTFFTIMLLPMALFLRSTVSYDGLLLPITLLSVVELFNLIYTDKKFNKKHIIFFIIVGYILLNVKTIYSVLFSLVLFIPKNKFENRKQQIKYYSIIIISVLLLTIFSKMFIVTGESNEIVQRQMEYIMSNPFDTIKILLTNMNDQKWSQLYWMTGTFGLLDTYIPPIFVYIISLNLIIISLIEASKEKIKIKLNTKLIVFLSIFMAIFASYFIMYMSWSPVVTGEVGGHLATGVQGRYFIPLLFCLPIIFSNNIKIKNQFIKNKLTKIYDNYILIPIISLLVMLVIIVLRFWV